MNIFKRIKNRAKQAFSGIKQFFTRSRKTTTTTEPPKRPAAVSRSLPIDLLPYRTVKEIPKTEIFSYGRKVQDIVNKHIEELRKFKKDTGAESPELRYIEESGGNISIKSGASYRDLEREIKRGLNYLSHQTSTVEGFKEMLERIQTDYAEQFGQKLTYGQLSEAFAIRDSLKQNHPNMSFENYWKDIKQIVDMMKSGKGFEEIRMDMEKLLEDTYVKHMEEEANFYKKEEEEGYVKPW